MLSNGITYYLHASYAVSMFLISLHIATFSAKKFLTTRTNIAILLNFGCYTDRVRLLVAIMEIETDIFYKKGVNEILYKTQLMKGYLLLLIRNNKQFY